MVPCNTVQVLAAGHFAGNKAARSSNYCTFDGRYVTKAHWNSDENPVGGNGKILQAQTDYSVGRDIMHGEGYRLPTIKELLRLVNFDVSRTAPADQLFSDYEVVNNWFKTSPTAFLDGYIVSSTFDKVSKNVYGIDIASRHVVKLDPLAIYTNPAVTPALITDNIATAPLDRPLFILGVSDYFQIISKADNKCVEFAGHNNVLILSACDATNIKQRWTYDSSNFEIRNQYRESSATGSGLYCYDHGTNTIAYGYDCDLAGAGNTTHQFSINGVVKSELIINEFLKIKVVGGEYYLTNNGGDLITSPVILDDSQTWILQY